MPPKKEAKKEDEPGDGEALPPLNSLIFTVIPRFNRKDHREVVMKAITDSFPEKCKTISREEIVSHGKAKGIITDPPPADDPEAASYSPVQQLAKAAADKLSELGTATRRSKRDRWQKAEEDAKAGATEENPNPQPNVNPDEIDSFYNLPDYPATQDEALSLNDCGYAINAVFVVEDQPIIEEDLNDSKIEQQDERTRVSSRVDELRKARALSQKGSALRKNYVRVSSYVHEVREATEEQEGRNSVDEISKTFFPEIEKIAENLVKYHKFHERFKAKPPVSRRPASIQTASKHKASRRVLSSDHAVSAEKFMPAEGEGLDPEAQEEGEKKEELEGVVGAAEDENISPTEGLGEASEHPRKTEGAALSLEDEQRNWDFSRYEELLGGLREEDRSIGAMLGAAILDVSREIEEVEARRRKAEDELEDMFREWEIQGSKEKEDKRLLSHSSNFFSDKPKTAGDSEYRVEDENSGPRSKNNKTFLSGESISALEEEMVRNFLIPGAGRTYMPTVPEKSARLRNAERPEIYPFCSLPIEDMERGLKL